MSASGQTSNLQLPIYANSDEPKYIPDFNSAMTKIDAGYASNLAKINTNTASIETTNENVTAVQAIANQALSTGNLALEKLININDIIVTLPQSATITNNTVKVINGVLCGGISYTTPSETQLSVTFNYNIQGTIATGTARVGTGLSSYTPRFTNGEIIGPISGNLLYLIFSYPWDSTWTKKA